MAADAVEALLLTRQWIDRRDGIELVFWAATPEGPLRLVFTGQEAVLFVTRGTDSVSARRREVDLEALSGAAVDALYFHNQRDLVTERDRLRATGTVVYEGSVRPHDRFLMERFITGGVAVEGAVRDRGQFREFINPRIRPSEFATPPSVLSLDIETEGLDGPLLSIAVAGAGGEAVWMKSTASDTTAFQAVPDEAALVRRLLDHLAAVDPDLIIGWNVVEFDLAYLERKATELHIPFALGRNRERATILPPRSRGQRHIARVPGRVVLDGIATLQAATYSFDSFRLQDVAKQLLGRGKLITPTSDPVAEIRRLYEHDQPALAAYNLKDCQLVLDVFRETDLVGFAVERQALTGLPMDRRGGAVAAFDHLYLPRLHRKGYVAPDVEDLEEFKPSPGGFVMESRPGLYENVLVLDFKSLYPSIIRTFFIDPLGLARPGADPVSGFSGASFARDDHILPGLIERLWAARDQAKRRGDAARSRAIKILMNSFYGVLGSPGCRFFSSMLASSITLRGHEILRESRRFIEDQGLEVIYGDTDSLFVHIGEADGAECAGRGRALAEELNNHWREHLAAVHRIESHLELEFETHFLRFLMPTMRGSDRGSKKRYAGSTARDGRSSLVIKGLEAVRTDWTPLARRFQRELLRRVFADEPWRDWTAQLAAALRAGQLDDELVYRKRIRRRLGDYQKSIPPHIQAARKLPRPVREVRYVITHRGAEPIDLPHGELDYEHYLSKQLAPAADCVLPFLGTDFRSVAGLQLPLFR